MKSQQHPILFEECSTALSLSLESNFSKNKVTDSIVKVAAHKFGIEVAQHRSIRGLYSAAVILLPSLSQRFAASIRHVYLFNGSWVSFGFHYDRAGYHF